MAYAQSKTAVVLMAVELDRRWADEGIRGYAAHPGVVVGTSLNSAVGDEALHAMGLIDSSGKPVIDIGGEEDTPAGRQHHRVCGHQPWLNDTGGVYLKDNDISPVNDEQTPVTADTIPAEVASHAIDPRSAQRLWEIGEHMLSANNTESGEQR